MGKTSLGKMSECYVRTVDNRRSLPCRKVVRSGGDRVKIYARCGKYDMNYRYPANNTMYGMDLTRRYPNGEVLMHQVNYNPMRDKFVTEYFERSDTLLPYPYF